MLVDLLSPCNYVSFNVQLAQVVGLHAAVYLSELLNVNSKAIRKNTVQDDSFHIDRAYVTSRTTLTESEQKSIESTLLKLGILKLGNSQDNAISIDITVLTSILMSPDESLLNDLAKLRSTASKATKGQKIVENLKTNIVCTNEELRKAYEDWIDAVYAKDGWMSKKAVISAQQLIDDFSKRDLDVALRILDIAAINGYRDVSWAINTYKKENNINSVNKNITFSSATPIRTGLSNEVF